MHVIRPRGFFSVSSSFVIKLTMVELFFSLLLLSVSKKVFLVFFFFFFFGFLRMFGSTRCLLSAGITRDAGADSFIPTVCFAD